MKISKCIALSLCLALFFIDGKGQSNIYGFSTTTADGSTIQLSTFEGKKILIIPTASQDSTFGQYNDLLRLSERFRDSLVIIVCPTNSFQSEPLDNAQLVGVYVSTVNSPILVCSKVEVTGAGIDPLFKWLTTAAENGVLDTPMNAPFKKFLIDRNGRLAGVYNSNVGPMAAVLFNAVNQ